MSQFTDQNIVLPKQSFIACMNYKSATSELFIVMRKDGKRYKYLHVPIQIFEEIMNSTNKGSMITQHVIHGGYKCEPMQPVPMATLEKIIEDNNRKRYSNSQYTAGPNHWLGM
jgi:hypothetical protein